MEGVIKTRRQWLQAATLWPACLALRAARKEFWDRRESTTWTDGEKQLLLGQSPWAKAGFVRMELEGGGKKPRGYGNDGRPADGALPAGPGLPPGGVRSVPIGEPVPPVPDPDAKHPVQFPVLVRWESAKPVRLAGGPDVPDQGGQFYVIGLRGLPLMTPPKAKPSEEAAPNPNERMLQAIKEGSQLQRKDKPVIACSRLFVGEGGEASEVLIYFPRGAYPITAADRFVTLESRFAQFHLSIRFSLMDMMYKGELAL